MTRTEPARQTYAVPGLDSISRAVRVRGALDVARLRDGWIAVGLRHDVLRSRWHIE